MGISAFLTRSRRATALLALASAALGSQALLAPTASARAARSGSGGAALSGSGATPVSGSSTAAPTGTTGTPGTGLTYTSIAASVVGMGTPLQASGDGITVTLADFGTLHQVLKLTGTAPATDAGATIDIEVAAVSGVQTWTTVTSATIASTGAFTAVWVPSQSSTVELKAELATSLTAAPSATATTNGGQALGNTATAASSPTISATAPVTLPIFTDAIATLDRPGLWGRQTACGQVLRRATLGVASRTLKCGTMVAVYYDGRELSVPVIDRGPFANHASWDLTMATARALGVRQTSTVGTLDPAPATLLSAVRGHR
jgi:rare lipoprotein A